MLLTKYVKERVKMKKMIKDILFISYLKNKGVRRICFIVGVLLAILPITIWYEGLNDNFYDRTYKNISEFSEENKYNTERQREVFNKYPINVKFNSYDFSDFYEWKTFWMDTKMYANKYDKKYVIFTICAITHPNFFRKSIEENLHRFREMFPQYDDLSAEALEEKLNEKYGEQCFQFGQFFNQEITISKTNYLYLLKLLWSLLWFYLPFLLSCIIKWVYTGFKEK